MRLPSADIRGAFAQIGIRYCVSVSRTLRPYRATDPAAQFPRWISVVAAPAVPGYPAASRGHRKAADPVSPVAWKISS